MKETEIYMEKAVAGEKGRLSQHSDAIERIIAECFSQTYFKLTEHKCSLNLKSVHTL